MKRPHWILLEGREREYADVDVKPQSVVQNVREKESTLQKHQRACHVHDKLHLPSGTTLCIITDS